MNKTKEQIQIAVVGDILTTRNVLISASKLIDIKIKDPYRRVASGFERLFSKEVKKHISSADIVFGNLENPIAEGLTEKWHFDKNGRPLCKKIDVKPGNLLDNKAYRYNPSMIINAHPALALALKNIGFDVVSTANNHFANRASNGIDSTIDALRKANLSHVGTLKYDEIINNDGDFPTNTPYVIKESKGIRVAFLGFTSPVNHIVGGLQLKPVFLGKLLKADEFCSRQVYSIVTNNNPVEYNVKKFCECIKKSKEKSDIVAVSTHFGIWQMHEPSELQKQLAKRFLDAGADIIIGHGPHVIQPMEEYITKDGRKTFIIYSLGNFLIDGGTEEKPSLTNSLVSFIGLINITKDDDRCIISNIDYIPTLSHKEQNGFTQVIVPDLSKFKKIKEIIKKVFDGTKEDRKSLSRYYLSKWTGGWLMIKDDDWWEQWILRRWKRGK